MEDDHDFVSWLVEHAYVLTVKLDRLVCVDWLSGCQSGAIKVSLNKYNSPKTFTEIPWSGNLVKHSFGQRVHVGNSDKISQEAMWWTEKHSGFWGLLYSSADNLFCEPNKWFLRHNQLCKMRSRTTGPLHPISISIAMYLGVILDPVAIVGWPVPDPHPLGSHTLAHSHQSSVDTEQPAIG